MDFSLGDAITALKPGPIFRRTVMLYADRKLFLLLTFHTVMTLVVCGHFALKKFDSQMEKVPEAAPFHSWKVGVPTFEFGMMHAILFQLAVIPLTMCRLSIRSLSSTFLNRFVPFDSMTQYHIAVGYAVVIFLVSTTAIFFMFFGVICNSGDASFCAKFTTEIMITGYAIFVAFASVGITSFLRHKIKYRIFYVIHHIVFLAYILTIAHTIDVVERKKGGRSQTFKWFSASILLYVCDRAAMYLHHRYFTTVESAVAIDTDDGNGKLVILKVKKPELFHFSSGQYVYLKVPSVDNRWHPYSIGSGPEAKTLNFYIKVYGDKSWSGRLFQLFANNDEISSTSSDGEWYDDVPSTFNANQTFKIEILGPYGTSLGVTSEYTKAMVIGTGTGFVPCMSALSEYTEQCLALEPNKYEKGLLKSKSMMGNLERSKSIVKNTMASHHDVDSNSITKIASIIENAQKARRQLNAHVFFLVGPAIGLYMLGVTLSWNTLPFELYSGMKEFLIAGSITFQAIFFLSTLRTARTITRNAFTYVDFIVTILNAVADWFWFSKGLWGDFDDQALVFYSLLVSFMFLRLWTKSLQDASYNPVKDSNERRSGHIVYDKFTFVWSCRSAEFIAQVYPDILKLWEDLVVAWGGKKATQMCEIRIHCTDRDQDACQRLIDGIQMTALFQQGAVKFGRPSIQKLLEKNISDAIKSPSKSASRTLLAYCGSYIVGREVKKLKVLNDIFLMMSGNMIHGLDVVIQTYNAKSNDNYLKSDGARTGTGNDPDIIDKTSHPFEVTPNPKNAPVVISKLVDRNDLVTTSSFENAFRRMEGKEVPGGGGGSSTSIASAFSA